jgi:hypothetical protein
MPKTPEGAIMAHNQPGIGGMSVYTKSADAILAAVQRGRQALEAIH